MVLSNGTWYLCDRVRYTANMIKFLRKGVKIGFYQADKLCPVKVFNFEL